VLLAGKGHETDQIWGTEHRPFDERVVVAEVLGRVKSEAQRLTTED
jgi:UDP-N-acetylmuramyl tripeptide synthase